MATPRSNSSLPDGENRTQVQRDNPRTVEFANDATSPTFGTLPPGGVPEFPFLSPPRAADEVGRLGDYRVLKKLGEGGMGFVFRCEDPALKRFVALKVMRPEVAAKPQAADRFLREGRAAAGLKSDHIITVYGVGTANGVPYLAMEFLEGLPLDEWIKAQKKAVPLQHALRVVRDTLRGLAVAHEKGLIHRDIKPANLWIEKGTSRIKILDFGLTRGNDGDVQLTQEGAVVGTPAYMAPEQAGGKPVDPRADLFSVGVVFYTLLAGKNPFTRDSLMATLGAVGFETQPPVRTVRPDVPPEYSAFLDRLLAKDANGRPANAKAALQELAAIERKLADVSKTVATSQPLVAIPLDDAAPQVWGELDDDAPTVRLPQPAAAGPKKPANTKLLLGGGLFAFLLALGGIIIVITNKDGSKTTVEVPDGAKVEVKDGGKTVATVGGKKAVSSKKPVMDADRKAAEFVLANGGLVQIGEREYQPNDAAALPAEPFQCVRINLAARELTDAEADLVMAPDTLQSISINYPLTEANLVRLAKQPAAKTLRELQANATALRDGDLKRFRDFPQLEGVAFGTFTATGAGLKDWDGWGLKSLRLYGLTDAFQDDNLKDLGKLPNLMHLSLGGSGLTDGGVKHVGEISTLEHLSLDSERLSDAGLQPLQKLAKLNKLWLANFPEKKGPLTGAALDAVGRIPNLAEIYFTSIPVRDADTKPLLGMAKLRRVHLDHPGEFGDAGLLSLTGIKTLEWVGATGGRVTADGVKKFRAARPGITLGGALFELADPDRAAAALVLGKGGFVTINTNDNAVHEAAKLPAEPFKLKGIDLRAPAAVTDVDLDLFRDLSALEHLSISGPVTDAGVAKLAASPAAANLKLFVVYSPELTDAAFASVPKFASLVQLQFQKSTKITGAGLVHLKGSNVEYLSVGASSLADAELAKLKDLPKLTLLDLTETPITDAGLKHVGGLKQLTQLHLYGVRGVTDAGAKHLEGLTELVVLHANAVPFGDAAFASLAKLPKLKVLHAPNMANVADAGMNALAKSASLELVSLGATPLTDAGLLALSACKTLKQVQVGETKVTAAGVAAFRKARPDVTVQSDFDNAAAPAADPDRAAAAWVIDRGGYVRVLGQQQDIKAAADLPPDRFTLTFVHLGYKQVTDADLDRLQPAAGLNTLVLSGKQLTDVGLEKLKAFPALTRLDLSQQPVSDAGVKHLKELKALRMLALPGVAGVTDAGLEHLRELRYLRTLNVGGTKVTAAAAGTFQQARPDCRVEYTGGVLERPAPAADPDRAAAEKLLPLFDLDILPAGRLEAVKLKAGSPVPTGAFVVTGVRCWAVDSLPRGFADDVLLPAVAPLTRLTHLEDAGSKIEMSKADPAKWGGLAAWESLRQFELAVPLTAAWIDTFRPLPNLTAIHVTNGQSVPVTTLRRLSELKALESLRIFNLQGQDRWAAVTALPLKKLAPAESRSFDRPVCERIAAMPALETFPLYDVPLTADMLAALTLAPKLRSLTFTKCSLPATGFDHLARLPSLNALNIKAKEFGDVQLAQLAGAATLQFLRVNETSVTEAGVKALAAKLPGCTIEWAGGRVKGR